MRRVPVTRTTQRILPDPRRVIVKPHLPGEETYTLDGKSRVKAILERVLAIPNPQVASVLEEVLSGFAPRHRDFERVLQNHFHLVDHHLGPSVRLSEEQRLLIGAYFSHEYSIEGAALFNPSMVPAPDQGNLASGDQRFVMSVRAVGEGHVSSIGFRTGILDQRCDLTFDPVSRYTVTGTRKTPKYDKNLFVSKLDELGADHDLAATVLAPLPELFTFDDLERGLVSLEEARKPANLACETVKMIHLLASSNYVVTYPPESAIWERVIFPAGPRETQGMEDARFVRFVNDDGSTIYYATYTAFDGFEILPQLIETRDFLSFRVATLNGRCAQNKGMALFPRLIDGKYTMLSRFDTENSYLMRSDNVRHWSDTQMLRAPMRPWELIQIGNCGSPIETDAGWLVLTHGVGPMRRYAIGALLLDLEDPTRVIGHLPDPLLEPEEDERDGYVPNVLYSCGGLVHQDTLVLPYAFSDAAIRIALIAMSDLLDALIEHRCIA